MVLLPNCLHPEELMLCYADSEYYGTEVHPFIFILGYCIHSISLSTVWGAHIVLQASAFQD